MWQNIARFGVRPFVPEALVMAGPEVVLPATSPLARLPPRAGSQLVPEEVGGLLRMHRMITYRARLGCGFDLALAKKSTYLAHQ